MGILDHDHSSEKNPLKVIADLQRRVEDLERAQPSGLFVAGTTTMEPPGNINLSSSYDYQIANYPVAFGRVCSLFLTLPGLVAFWPMSAVRRDSLTDQVRDLAGGAYHLTNNNTALFGYENLIPHVEFDGVDQYLSRADGGAADWADILGTESYIQPSQQGLTVGGWFRLDTLVQGGNKGFISKWNDNGVNERSYLINFNDGADKARFFVSNDGTAVAFVTGSVLSAATWYFLVGRLDNAGNEIKIWTNSVTNTAVYNNTVFDGAADFNIGAYDNGLASLCLDGCASMCFLCAAGLSDAIVGQAFQQSRAMFGA